MSRRARTAPLPCMPQSYDDAFRRWIDAAPLADLLRAWESRAWHTLEGDALAVKVGYRIPPPALHGLRRRLAARIAAEEGGAIQYTDVIVRSDGETVWTEMATTKAPMPLWRGLP